MSDVTVTTTPVLQSHALVTYGGESSIERRALPMVASGEVRIRVTALGLCRTDLSVMSGEISTAGPRVPGHEFSGVVEEIGLDVEGLVLGERVVVNPWLACGACTFCVAGHRTECQETRFVGLDIDGACAEQIVVPAQAVYRIPSELPSDVAVFAEPLAASLAVLKGGMRSADRGLILGEGRLAELVLRALHAHRIDNVDLLTIDSVDHAASHQFDFAIETIATTDSLKSLIRVLKPRGKLILKSRQPVPIQLTLMDLLSKEPQIIVVNYGSFEEAIRLLAARTVVVDDLIGPKFSLSDYAAAFKTAAQDELQKVFVYPNGLAGEL